MMFIAHDIAAARVNLQMNDYSAGLPSPLSFLGLAESLVRDLGLAHWTASVIPILHSVTISDGRTKPEMEHKSGKFKPVETIEDLVGHVRLSLIIDMPGCESATKLSESLLTKRLAGGIIQNEGIRVNAITPDGSFFRGIRRGYALVRPDQQTPEYLQICTGNEDGLSQIAHKIFPTRREPGSGWYVPIAVGHKLLEDPDLVPKRIRTRCQNTPHVFAEPILGMAEFISVRNSRLSSLNEKELRSLFWQWTMQGDFILGHGNYLLNFANLEDTNHG